MKTFITGGTGFIGTHLVRRMAQADHEIVCLVRQTSDVSTLKKLGASLTWGDVTDIDSMLPGMMGCKWVVNLANFYTFWEPDRQVYKEINVIGTQKVMECALETGVSKVIHVSTMTTYGKPADVPFTEKSEVGPVRFSEYARTKYQGDLIVRELYKKKGLPVVIIYPGSVLGMGDNKVTGQYIHSLVLHQKPVTIFNNSVITYVHVKDVIDVIVRALEKENNIGEKYLVGKEQLSLKELNKMVEEISGTPLPKICLPDSVSMATAVFLTRIADLIKQPPMLGIAIEHFRILKEGMRGDGSKVEKEMGITYTPIRAVIEEAVLSYAT